MTSLQDFLHTSSQKECLQSIVLTISEGVRMIHENISSCESGLAGTENATGDQQMALDILANNLLEKELTKNDNIFMYASEEKETTKELHKNGEYSIAFDPLDGSSLIDTNLAIGTIFGIYESQKFIGQKGKDQACAGYAIYGPRTTLFISFGDTLNGFTLDKNKNFILSHKDIQVQEDSKIFSPGNLRASMDHPQYLDVLHSWIASNKTLRYSGAMVSEINAIFCKKQGIFTYPPCNKNPKGKLRLLYECAPMSFLAEAAGGVSVNHENENITDIEITDIHQRTPIFIGSKNEVNKVISMLYLI
jgi:fructose-1,6-bisphosphatase I